jgi:uncharacterized protein YbcI
MRPTYDPSNGNAPSRGARDEPNEGDADTRAGEISRACGNPSDLKLITREIVTIYKEQYGRGPKFAHSHYGGPDSITCILEGSMTQPERTLAGLGEHQSLRATRLLFQYAGEDAFRQAVERVTGRRVIAFLSSIDSKADIASELFILERLGGPDPERADETNGRG